MLSVILCIAHILSVHWGLHVKQAKASVKSQSAVSFLHSTLICYFTILLSLVSKPEMANGGQTSLAYPESDSELGNLILKMEACLPFQIWKKWYPGACVFLWQKQAGVGSQLHSFDAVHTLKISPVSLLLQSISMSNQHKVFIVALYA